ncbi:hypothetical protein ACNKHR_27930 [Shigella flexneri]
MPKAQESIMGQQKQRNRRWVLASRPHGAPVPENFRLEEDDVATPVRTGVTAHSSFVPGPYMRGRMSDEPSYSPPVDIGGVMVGGTVSRVVESNHPDYQPGDWVLGYSGWQDHDISSGDDLVKLAIIRKIHRGRWVCWGCQALPLIWGCWISVSLKRAKRWW